MQINIDKKTGSLLTIIALLVGSLIFVLNTSNSSVNHADMSEHMSSASENSDLSGADVMFLQMMIPHHQQAIDMSKLALKNSQDLELLDLSNAIIKEQSSEIIQMRAWLKNAGASEETSHSINHMGGMLSDEEFARLENSTGNEFVRLWLEGMIGHHDGAIHMTNMIADADSVKIKKFGQGIVKSQTAQVEEMKLMLEKLK